MRKCHQKVSSSIGRKTLKGQSIQKAMYFIHMGQTEISWVLNTSLLAGEPTSFLLHCLSLPTHSTTKPLEGGGGRRKMKYNSLPLPHFQNLLSENSPEPFAKRRYLRGPKLSMPIFKRRYLRGPKLSWPIFKRPNL